MNNRTNVHLKEEELQMKTALILGVMIAFVSAIFTAGYNEKPKRN